MLQEMGEASGWQIDTSDLVETPLTVATVSRQLKRYLFVPDTHVPYHNKRSWRLMVEAARSWRPDGIVVMGDLADFFAVSSHSKDPRRVLQLKSEMQQANAALDDLDSLGATDRRFIAGNHCDRLQRYLQDKAPELFDFVDVPRLLHLEDRGWKYTPYKKYDRLGKLYMTHDVGSSGRYAVFRALETFAHSVVTAHTHRLQYIVEGDATGGSRVSVSFGWLGDVDAVDYMNEAQAKKSWGQGFGIGYHDTSSDLVYLVPVPIVNDTCVLEGVQYRVDK